METKSLLYGLIGFFLGGLLVSVAATTFDKPVAEQAANMSMADITESLKDKRGDEFDKAFITSMIEHHAGAVAMAKLSAQNAKHDEIKQLSTRIIDSQQAEVVEMKAWQTDWGYADTSAPSVEHPAH